MSILPTFNGGTANSVFYANYVTFFNDTRIDLLGKNSFRDEIETSENNKVEIIRRLFLASETTERISNRFPDRSQVHARVYVSPLRDNENNEIKTFEYTILLPAPKQDEMPKKPNVFVAARAR